MTRLKSQQTGWLFTAPAMLVVAVAQVAAAHPHFSSDEAHAIDAKIRISDDEIRFSLIFSLKYVEQIVEVERARPNAVSDAEAAALETALADYFTRANPVTVDGIRVLPVLTSTEWTEPVNPLYPDRPLPPDVEIELSYPLKGRPRQVSMVWQNFPASPRRERMGMVPFEDLAVQLRAFDERDIITFTAAEPEFVWHAPATTERTALPVPSRREPVRVQVPVLSVSLAACAALGFLSLAASRVRRRHLRAVLIGGACAVAGAGLLRNVGVVQADAPWNRPPALPDGKEAVAIFEALQRNVYRAFDYDRPGDIYDTLAESVDGDLLEEVYQEIYQSLILRDQGGAVAQVRAVDVVDAEMLKAGVEAGSDAMAFQVRSRWRVRGSVSHWGHVHSRTNEYEAVYAVSQREDRWKITGVDMLSQERVSSEDRDASGGPISGTGSAG